MPHESRLNNAGGYTYLLCGGGGFSFSFLLQPINRLFGLKTNASIIVLGFNWVDSLLNGSMGGKKTERDSVLDSQRYPMYKYVTTQKYGRKNKEGV